MKFSGVEIEPCPGVYRPSDDSFMLAEAVSGEVQGGERVLDLGTGTGIVALAAAARGAEVTACDVSEKALLCAEKNARLNGLVIRTVQGSLFDTLHASFELIVFKPPYLPEDEEEPEDELTLAWNGGRGGREVLDGFLREVKAYLAPQGRVLFVQSSLNDEQRSIEQLKHGGFKPVVVTEKNFFFEKLYVIKAMKL